MKSWNLGLAGLSVVLAGSAAASAGTLPGDEGNGYKFQEAPVNSLGVKGLAELRGKPVLIDFWGTR